MASVVVLLTLLTLLTLTGVLSPYGVGRKGVRVCARERESESVRPR